MWDDEEFRSNARIIGSRLSRYQRFWCLTGGMAFAALGFLAIFKTENEAGTAIALLAAGVLLLVGVQGTPLIKITAGDNSIELEHTRQIVAEKAQEEASDSPATAEAILDAYEAADPSAARDPSFASAKVHIYELQAKMALRRIAADLGLVEEDRIPRFAVDIGWRSADGLIIAEIRHAGLGTSRSRFRHRSLASRIRQQMAENIERLGEPGDRISGIVVVVNQHDLARLVDRAVADLPPVTRVVTWKPENGEAPLREALLHVGAV